MKLLLLLITMVIFSESNLTVTSSAFANNDFIPAKYTCDGASFSPPLTIQGTPKNTVTLAIIVDDPDAPGTFDHWVMWNIPPAMDQVAANSAPGVQGKNGKNENRYAGPCPPSGTHHYHFKVYALDTKLDLSSSADKKELLKKMEGHILATGELIGLYKRAS